MFNSLIDQDYVERYGREAHSKGNIETSHQINSKLDRELQKGKLSQLKVGETLINKGSEIFFSKEKPDNPTGLGDVAANTSQRLTAAV